MTDFQNDSDNARSRPRLSQDIDDAAAEFECPQTTLMTNHQGLGACAGAKLGL